MSGVGKAVKQGLLLCMASNDVNGMSLGKQPDSLLKKLNMCFPLDGVKLSPYIDTKLCE